jgi:hypothetical protein
MNASSVEHSHSAFRAIVISEVADFLARLERVGWLSLGPMQVYCRKAIRKLDGPRLMQTFDIANIEVHEDHRGEGLFKAFISEITPMLVECDFDAIYIENVFNPRWIASLSRDWIKIGDQVYPPSFYKELQ